MVGNAHPTTGCRRPRDFQHRPKNVKHYFVGHQDAHLLTPLKKPANATQNYRQLPPRIFRNLFLLPLQKTSAYRQGQGHRGALSIGPIEASIRRLPGICHLARSCTRHGAFQAT
jgi:hypothetical protein